MNTKINYKKELKEALDIALFKQPAMHAVAQEKGKTTFGYYIIIAGALLGLIGQQLFPAFFRPSFLFGIIMAVMQVVMAVIGIYLVSYIAKKVFKGHAQHDQFFRVASYAMILMWLSLIPQLSIISGLWGLALMFVILKVIHKLTTGGAIGTIVIAALLMFVVSAILSPVYTKFGGFGVMGKMNYGSGNINLNGAGNVEFGGDTMKYTNEKGETMEWKIPNMND
jgi:hypothetical protein